MKITIDTTNKIITLEESVKLGEFLDFLEEIFPNIAERRSYTLNLVHSNYTLPTLPYPNPYETYPSPWIITYGEAPIPVVDDRISTDAIDEYKRKKWLNH